MPVAFPSDCSHVFSEDEFETFADPELLFFDRNFAEKVTEGRGTEPYSHVEPSVDEESRGNADDGHLMDRTLVPAVSLAFAFDEGADIDPLNDLGCTLPMSCVFLLDFVVEAFDAVDMERELMLQLENGLYDVTRGSSEERQQVEYVDGNSASSAATTTPTPASTTPTQSRMDSMPTVRSSSASV